jgi:hypothetical protein
LYNVSPKTDLDIPDSIGLALNRDDSLSIEIGATCLKLDGGVVMMKLLTLAAATAATLGMVSAGAAADLPRKEPPPPTPVVGKSPIGKVPIIGKLPGKTPTVVTRG